MSKKEVAEELWKIIDDIDTALDMYKGDDAGFKKYVANKVTERFEFIETDGFSLFWK